MLLLSPILSYLLSLSVSGMFTATVGREMHKRSVRLREYLSKMGFHKPLPQNHEGRRYF